MKRMPTDGTAGILPAGCWPLKPAPCFAPPLQGDETLDARWGGARTGASVVSGSGIAIVRVVARTLIAQGSNASCRTASQTARQVGRQLD